jgi:hypothetical protein
VVGTVFRCIGGYNVVIFDYFFEEYKNKIYKGNRRRITWFEWILVILPIVNYLVFFIFSMLKFKILIVAIPFVLMVLSFLALYIYVEKRDKKNLNELLQNYRDDKIKPIEELLKKENYNLYSISGIDWLINNCKEKYSNNIGLSILYTIKNFFITAIYPIITLAIGIVISNNDTNIAIKYSMLVIAMSIAILGFWMIIKPFFTEIIFIDKIKYEILCKNLEYIKTQINK